MAKIQTIKTNHAFTMKLNNFSIFVLFCCCFFVFCFLFFVLFVVVYMDGLSLDLHYFKALNDNLEVRRFYMFIFYASSDLLMACRTMQLRLLKLRTVLTYAGPDLDLWGPLGRISCGGPNIYIFLWKQ